MKKLLILSAFMAIVAVSNSQSRYVAKNGFISFYSHTPIEDIKAENRQVSSILDAKTGEVVFNVLMKSFNFEKALMQEHFNENYVESDKYPKATFKGKISNPSSIDFTKDGTYNADASGEMTIHGVTKQVTTNGTIEVKGENVTLKSKFNLNPRDYEIKIPGVVKDKIAEQLEITVDIPYTASK